MDISMDFSSINSYREVYSGEKVCKLGADAVIPDTYDDIERLLGTEFSCRIISKDALFGKVTVSGELEAVSLFSTENSDKIASLRTVMPFSADFASEDIDSASFPVADIRIIASDYRELNPRKLGINAAVSIFLSVYNKSELSFPTAPGEADKAFFKTEQVSVNFVSAVSEKLSTLDDERETDAVSVLSGNTQYDFDSFELIGGRLIVKSHAHSRVVLLKESGEVMLSEYDIPFSQLFDCDEGTEVSDCELTVTPAGEYYELTDGILSTELRVVSQLVCHEKKEISCVTDAYACGCEYELKTNTLPIASEIKRFIESKTASLSFDLPENSDEVIISSVKFGKSGLSGGVVTVPVVLNALFSDKSKRVYPIRLRDSIEFSGVECECFEAVLSSAKCAVISGKAQFELQTELRCRSINTRDIELISGITLKDECKKAKPALYIVRAENGDIWSIAKKYGADQRRIGDINSISDGDSISGKMLLIPTT